MSPRRSEPAGRLSLPGKHPSRFDVAGYALLPGVSNDSCGAAWAGVHEDAQDSRGAYHKAQRGELYRLLVAVPPVSPMPASECKLPSGAVEPFRPRPEELQAGNSISTLIAYKNGARMRPTRRWCSRCMQFSLFARLAASLLHVDVGFGRIGHAGADVEARVGRLVVA
jgi:hypothetical protein